VLLERPSLEAEVPHRLGARVATLVSPLYAGALARAILAHLPPPEVDRILRAGRFRRLGPNTPTTAAMLRRRLREACQAGVAISVEEQIAGGAGVAAPVLGHDGLAIASIGVSAPQQRLTAESLRVLTGSVREAASALSALLRLHTHRVPPAV